MQKKEETLKQQLERKRKIALEEHQKDIILKKRNYQEVFLEKIQTQKIEQLKNEENREQNNFKKFKEKILSRFTKNQENFSLWDKEETTNFTNKDQEIILQNSSWDNQEKEGNLKMLNQSQNTMISKDQQFSTNLPEKISEEQLEFLQNQIELEKLNKFQTDEELNELLPKEGFEIVDPPKNYKETQISRLKNNTSKIVDPNQNNNQYSIPESKLENEKLPAMTQSDLKYFGELLKNQPKLSKNEQTQQKILILLLKIKNGSPEIRKNALKTITEKAKEFGAEFLLQKIMPMLMDSSLDQQEKHLMVKTLDRIIFKLDSEIQPYVQKILSVVQSMLIDEDFIVRIEGREIISNLAKSAGLSTLITSIRTEIENPNADIREITAQVFAVGANALTIPKALPFIKAVCRSKKSYLARHTGCKIVFHLSKLLGSGILPHLKELVFCLQNCLQDEVKMVKISAALAISSLASSTKPFGIEAFDLIMKDLWEGLNKSKGRVLAAFLKAIGNIIPLMDKELGNQYTSLVLRFILKHFDSPEDEMKKIILKVLYEAFQREEIDIDFVKKNIFEKYFENFWTIKISLNRGASFRLIETTSALAKILGSSAVLKKLTFNLKEDHEIFRQVTMRTIQEIIEKNGLEDVNNDLEELLVDAALFAFLQQNEDKENFVLKGLASVINGLKFRAQKYLSQLFVNITVRLKTSSITVREQAVELIASLAPTFLLCDGNNFLKKFCQILFENLGEEYPEVLGSILKALQIVTINLGVQNLEPGVEEILPSLTPILKNRNEKVQKHLVILIGQIASEEYSAEKVEPKEWIRICMDLLDLFKANKKETRKAAINTFGYIAKLIGPSDVLVTLINNLKVQDRQMRICTTVAIAVIAETCGPFCVLPALMNEYRVPLNHVQNGVLKTIVFIFEYVGQKSKDYIWGLIPLLEHALVSKDTVHKQIACNSLRNLALGVFGFGYDKFLLHLFNFVFPNIFENQPHLKNGVFEAFEALRLAVGPGEMMLFVLQGLFHPAKRVREVYWGFYNNLYIGAQDALCPFQPVFEKKDKELNVNENFYLIQANQIK